MRVQLILLWALSAAYALKVPLSLVNHRKNHLDVYVHGLAAWFNFSPIHIDPQYFETAMQLGWKKLRVVAVQGLDYASNTARDSKEDIEHFKDRVDSLVSAAEQLRYRLLDFHGATSMTDADGDTVKALGINWTEFSEEFARMLDSLQESLKAQFPPPDQAANHAQRSEMIAFALSQVEECFIRLSVKSGIHEDKARELFEGVKPIIQEVLVLTGDLAEQHPELFVTVLISGVLLVLPEGFILQPILRLFGFGPYGPVKGSSAAWAQKRFFGAVVPARSWFAALQSLGMKVPAMVAAPIGSAIGWMGATVGGVGLAMRSCW